MKKFLPAFFRLHGPITPPSAFLSVIFPSLLFGALGRLFFLMNAQDHMSMHAFLTAAARGFGFDLAVAMYLLIPLLPLLLFPEKVWAKQGFQRLVFSVIGFDILTLTLSGASELLFLEEFHSRFNFIAVDYLVYTNEVLKNAWQSYPMWLILPCVALSAFYLTIVIVRFATRVGLPSIARVNSALMAAITFGVLTAFLAPSEAKLLEGLSSLETEFSKNGTHALFSAYISNEIDYNNFYSSNGKEESEHIVHEHMELDYGIGSLIDHLDIENENSIARNIEPTGPEKRLNVVVVLMESMSARFMDAYGAQKHLTPNLDSLARNGLFFDRLYATGTRTVRGIEAVLLSIPPTPGQSIVRRPEAGELFSMGTVFREKGYSTEFVYGGRAYFDNMKQFFESNKFAVADETDIPKNGKTFSNAWGVSDDDLFDFALARQAEKIKQRKPFFQFVLTTSNHRPYTFPPGRIDLPSPSGRDGAVKYSDFAIGEFIEKSKKMPWFKDTVYIFVADHNASVAGGTKVLPADYRIPAIFYSPAHIKPSKNSLLSSQIDIAPTLFGLLNFSYQSKFFGHDLAQARTARAFLGTYQKVGLWENNKLVLLSPNFELEIGDVDGENLKNLIRLDGRQKPQANVEASYAIAYYETASSWFKDKLLKESKVYSKVTNIRTF